MVVTWYESNIVPRSYGKLRYQASERRRRVCWELRLSAVDDAKREESTSAGLLKVTTSSSDTAEIIDSYMTDRADGIP